MRLHKNTTADKVRSWPPAVQVGHVASELSRAASLIETGGPGEALGALLRARELLGVMETCPALPVGWGPDLADAVHRLALDKLGNPNPAEWRSLQARLMGLLERTPAA